MKTLILLALAFCALQSVTSQATSCQEAGCFWSYVSGEPCQCNTDCHLYGNCCSDYYTFCGSCADRAGDTDTSVYGCHCSHYGDPETLCQDYLILASCSVECTPWYDSDLACQCTSDCDNYGNCCEDFSDYCVAVVIDPTELSVLADDMWAADTTRLLFGTDYNYNVQFLEADPLGNQYDQSFDLFFTFVQSAVLERSTIKSYVALRDNFSPELYNQERISYSQRDEVIKFWDDIMATEVMTIAYNELNTNFNYRYDSFDQFRGDVENIWYGIVNHGSTSNFPGDTNGFENHFLYEVTDDGLNLQGGYSWLELYYGEEEGELNYHSHSAETQPGTDQNIVTVQFSRTSDGLVQPSAPVLMGSSPEFDIAMGYICFKNLETGGACSFSLNGQPMTLSLSTMGYDNGLIQDAHFT